MAMSEDGEDACIEWDSRQQPRKPWTNIGCDARHQQDKTCANQNPGRDVPFAGRGLSYFHFGFFRHQPQTDQDYQTNRKEEWNKRNIHIL